MLMSMNAAIENTEAAIFSRVVAPENANLTPEAARSILQIAFPPTDVVRMNQLAEKAREGALTDSESNELESYRHVGRILEVLKSKARLSLKTVCGAA